MGPVPGSVAPAYARPWWSCAAPGSAEVAAARARGRSICGYAASGVLRLSARAASVVCAGVHTVVQRLRRGRWAAGVLALGGVTAGDGEAALMREGQIYGRRAWIWSWLGWFPSPRQGGGASLCTVGFVARGWRCEARSLAGRWLMLVCSRKGAGRRGRLPLCRSGALSSLSGTGGGFGLRKGLAAVCWRFECGHESIFPVVNVRVLVWVVRRCWRKLCRAFGRFDDGDVRGRHFPSWGRCLGENLVPTLGRAAAAFHVVSFLGASLRGSTFCMGNHGLFFSTLKPSWLDVRRGLAFFRAALLLRWAAHSSSELLVDGVAAMLGNDDMLHSLPRCFGAGRMQEWSFGGLADVLRRMLGLSFAWRHDGFNVAAVVQSALLGRVGG
uniref:Uncharacterized protein n=1 Tax=Leersia perrieri TaxID=77586 RepID=A0A0D9W7X6_9ORYZ